MAKNEFAKLLKVINRIKLSSLNKAGRSAMSRTTKFVRQGYNISKKMIDDRLKETKAKSIQDPIYKISISPKALPLMLFKPKQLGKIKAGTKLKRKRKNAGVKVSVKKKQPVLIQSAFIAELKYGENVFIRESADRSKVHALYGPQVQQLFSSARALNMLDKEASERFSKIFLDRIEHEASKLSSTIFFDML